MEPKIQWISKLKDIFRKSPLAPNVVFGFMLMGLEKLVELEFECPCDPKWNGMFSAAFFVIPAIMAFILMLILQKCRHCVDIDWFKKTVCSIMTAILWVIILLFDGQYLTCAKTDWKGRFVLIDKAHPQKWCEPISEGNFTREDLMLRSKEWITLSQGIAICSLAVTCLVLAVYQVNECRQNKKSESPDPKEEMIHLETS